MILVCVLILKVFSTLPSNFFRALEHFRKGDINAADSLLNIAYFEADLFSKNDVLIIKEVLSKYANDEKVMLVLGEYLIWYYSGEKRGNISFNYQELENKDIKAFLKLQVEISNSKVIDSLLIRDFWEIEDTLLIFVSVLRLIKKFGKQNNTLTSRILKPLQLKYPQTPYFELISGYLR